MATSAIAGYKAIVKTSTSSTGGTQTTIGELRDYTLSMSHSTFDATSHDSSGERERIGGISEWTGSAEALFVNDATSQTQALDLLNGRIKADFSFMPVGSSSGDHFTGTGFVTNYELTGPNEDAAAISLEFEGTGVITHSSST